MAVPNDRAQGDMSIHVGRLVRRRFLPRNAWSDREFCRRRFVRRHGRSPNPHKPERFIDHLYRIKTNGSLLNSLCQFITDKEFAKLYIAHAAGPDHLPEIYPVLRNAGDIEAFVPDRVRCVMKPTHLNRTRKAFRARLLSGRQGLRRGLDGRVIARRHRLKAARAMRPRHSIDRVSRRRRASLSGSGERSASGLRKPPAAGL